ncbi:hypothetical protein BAY61_03195 [Prauserella marina]|nr:hypothetical protein BAY61_03195 [Prauserella marina]
MEDVLSDDILRDALAEPLVDDERPREVVGKQRRYLPPPSALSRRRQLGPPPEPENKLARRAKLGALILATAFLVAAIVVAATLAGDGEHASQAAAHAPLQITGAAALAGFAVPASKALSRKPLATRGAVPVSGGTGTDGRATGDVATPHGAGEIHTAHRAHDVSDAAIEPVAAENTLPATSEAAPEQDNTRVVREFYALVDHDPVGALSMVAPSLAGDDRDQLVEAWRSMASVTVDELTEKPDGSVRAVITIVPIDGNPLTVVQQLSVNGRPHTVIKEAKLLSVQPK